MPKTWYKNNKPERVGKGLSQREGKRVSRYAKGVSLKAKEKEEREGRPRKGEIQMYYKKDRKTYLRQKNGKTWEVIPKKKVKKLKIKIKTR